MSIRQIWINRKIRQNNGLEHPSLLEHPEDEHEGDDHEGENHEPGPAGMTEEPAELDIHSEETGNQGRRHEQKGHEGKDLHDLVLIEVDDTQNSVLEIFKTFETEIGMIDQGRNVLEKHIQFRMILDRIFLALDDA